MFDNFFKLWGCKGLLLKFYVITLVLISCQSSDTQLVEEHYDNGQISRQYYLKNGKKEGEYKKFLIDGSLQTIYQFKDDLQHGKTTHYFKSGQLQEVQYYDNGKRYLSDTVFYESGLIELVTDFLDDKKHGYTRKYSEDGKLIFEAKWENDQFVSLNDSLMKK